jgi:hypothetical protein
VREAALALGLALLAGPVAAQAPRPCLPPDEVMMAPSLIQDLIAAREVCGRDEPQLRAVAIRLEDLVLRYSRRIAGRDAERRLREQYRQFIAARADTYRERGLSAADCAMDPQFSRPEAELVRLIESRIAEFNRLTAPGGPFARPDCRPR